MRPRAALLLLLCLLLVTMTTLADSRKCRKKKGGKKCDRKSGEDTTSEPRQTGRDIADKTDGKVALKWRKKPKDTLLIQREGSKAAFNCRADGQPRPKVVWTKDGASVNSIKNENFHKSKWKLQIDDVTKGDSGNYTCLITNPAGRLEWTYTLRVLDCFPSQLIKDVIEDRVDRGQCVICRKIYTDCDVQNHPISEISIIERPKNQTAHVGDTVVFMCRSDTWPAPSVHWFRKAKNKLVVEIIQMDNNTLAEVLVLHNVTKGDAGEYTCYIGTDIKSVELMATLTVIEEGESLPFEPKCALHIRRQILMDNTFGCQTVEPVEITYCMGSCGRSYFIPTMVTTDDADMQTNHLNQTCRCCVGLVQGIRIVQLHCPGGEKKRGFFTLLRDCECQKCNVEGEFKRQTGDSTVSLAP